MSAPLIHSFPSEGWAPLTCPLPPVGRKAVLALIQKARYREVLLAELQTRRPPRAVRLGLPYHIHDLIGAQLVRW